MSKPLFKLSSWVVFVFMMHFGQSFAQVDTKNNAVHTSKSKYSLLDMEQLLDVKTKLKTSPYVSLNKKMLQAADSILKLKPMSVMQKTQTPASGTKHDYLSIGPYWWPDPTKADGLPWIRKDGQVNPQTREGSTDFETKEKVFHNTKSLAFASFFSDKKQYAEKALALIKVWFLNEATKMNPNLNFAQGIPGENSGRGIGIIEFADVTSILESIELLERNQTMDAATSQGMRQWFTDYVLWLQTSENGVFEKNTKNNHGTHYDAQLVSLLVFLDRIDEAKQILESVKTERIAKQIKPNGAQPLELARTKALSYSTMNLKGMTELAIFGKMLGVDLWNYQAENGASIKEAYVFLKPYAKGDKIWDYQQIGDLTKATAKLKDLFAFAGAQFAIEEYCQIGDKNTSKKSLEALLNSCK